MRLTRAPQDPGDDLGAALAARFGDVDAPSEHSDESSGESLQGIPRGSTLAPEQDLVEELRRQVAALESLKQSAKSPAPNVVADPRPPEPAPDLTPLPAPPGPFPPRDLATPPAPPTPPGPPGPVRFGPTTFAPPTPPPVLDLPVPPSPGTFGTRPGPTPDVPEPVSTSGLDDILAVALRKPPAPGSPTRAEPETSDDRRSDKKRSTRKRLGRRKGENAEPEAPAPEPVQLNAEPDAGPRHVGRPLGELLIGRGLVSEDQLREALTTQTGSGKRLGNILVELGLLSERHLVQVLAEQLQLEIVDLGRLEVDPEVGTLLSEDDARRLRAVPIARDGARIEVAVADPLAEHLQEQLIEKLAAPVRLRFATGTDIDAVINKMHAGTADLGDALRVFEARLEARKQTKEAEQQTTTVVDENAPIVKVVNVILEQAVRERASDIHIEPMDEDVRVRVRTDGALHEIMKLPNEMASSLISRIKVMSDMNIVERRKPQDGQLAAKIAGRDLDVRVSTTPTMFGEKCVMRVLDKSKGAIDLSLLGMDRDTYGHFEELIRSPYGMVICAGPTGSGKTTTLYATLSAINNATINVVTVEDPVEYVFPSINQIQIHEASGVTFASGLRAILRQDPDAILVGEIRDIETARIAVQAAMTGHFVMSSLHATDATSALHRFMDMGVEPFLVASSLLGVVGQRLVRKICPHCAEAYVPEPEEMSFYERSGGDMNKDTFVRGAGCAFCAGTGYYERVGIYEVLKVTDELKELIVNGAPQAELKQLAVAQGMRTLRQQAVQLVMQDKTTIAEVLRTVYVL